MIRAVLSGKADAVVKCLTKGDPPNVVGENGYTPLHFACLHGHLAICKILVDHHADLNATSTNGSTPLIIAGQEGRTEICTYLIGQKANLELKRDDGVSALLLAARQGYTEVCQILLDRDANASVTDNAGTTPLIAAAHCGHAPICRLLLQHHVLVNARDKKGLNALDYAIDNGHEDVCSELFKAGARYKSTEEFKFFAKACSLGKPVICEVFLHRGNVIANRVLPGGVTGLFLAAENGHATLCQYLCEKWQANPNLARASDQVSPLLIAAKNGHAAACKVLLDFKAQVNAQDSSGTTPAIAASMNGHAECLEVLIANGANVNARDIHKCTSLHFAARNGSVECVQLLLAAEAQVDSRRDNGATPLLVACLSSHAPVARLLLDAGANFQLELKDGMTPFLAACQEGSVEVAELLLKHEDEHFQQGGALLIRGAREDGANGLYLAASNGHAHMIDKMLALGIKVDSPAADGSTPLMAAAANGHEEVAQKLLGLGADVNAQARDGMTPFLAAASGGFIDICEFLLDFSADVTARAGDGRTAIMMALESGNKQCVLQLLEHRVCMKTLNLRDSRGRNALNYAIDTKVTELVDLIRQKQKEIAVWHHDQEEESVTKPNPDPIPVQQYIARALHGSPVVNSPRDRRPSGQTSSVTPSRGVHLPPLAFGKIDKLSEMQTPPKTLDRHLPEPIPVSSRTRNIINPEMSLYRPVPMEILAPFSGDDDSISPHAPLTARKGPSFAGRKAVAVQGKLAPLTDRGERMKERRMVNELLHKVSSQSSVPKTTGGSRR